MEAIEYLKVRLLCEKLRAEYPGYLVLTPEEDPMGKTNIGIKIEDGGPLVIWQPHKKRQEPITTIRGRR